MVRKFVLPILAVLGVVFAVRMMVASNAKITPAPPVAQPAESPYRDHIAGAGIVESSSENISIAPIVPGVVSKVYVKYGDRVKAGDPLFTVDDRDLQSDLIVKQAALAAAKARLDKELLLPRPEEVPPMQARVDSLSGELANAKSQLELYESLPDRRAVTVDEYNRRKFAVESAAANLAEARARMTLMTSGAWKPDVVIAQAEVTAAEAAVKAAQIELDRRTVRAPIDGTMLQVKIRQGEYAPPPGTTTSSPLMLLGSTDTLHVRVDVDENDAWRLKAGAAAVATVRGNRDLKTDLKYFGVEPYVIPKRSLTGESTERVDTRVLQVIFSFPASSLPVYVGQQMDVYIEAPPALRRDVPTTELSPTPVAETPKG